MLPIIENYNDIFHLPGDKLKGTNRIANFIPTTDNVSIVVKQYRYPPVHNVVGSLMGATNFRDLVGLGLGSLKSPEEHTTEFDNHFILLLIIH